jgi:fructuronate reductase
MTATTAAPVLNESCLPALAERGIQVPTYPRGGAYGVVHLGLGAFHRAHQALVFDQLLRSGDPRWGVLGVAVRSTQLADALAAQQGLYAVQVASAAGAHWQVCGSILRMHVAARERAAVVEALAAESTRWVTITVTEKGYGTDVIALLVDALAVRQTTGLNGLTLASCDNLTNNGDRLRALCIDAARARSPALTDWIDARCAFPNSMVDRIVPAISEQRCAAAAQALGVQDPTALGTEAFWEWVIERRFADPSDGPLLASAGVTVVDDVAPFEEAKLRMLNGSHSAMAFIGAVAGWPVIGDCIAQPVVREFIEGLMTHEVGPHLQRTDWPAYRDQLLARFGNPQLQHSVHQIATDSSQKIPQRWPPSALAELAAGRSPERLAFAAAAWLRYLRGVDDQGRSYVIKDPMADVLQPLARQHAGNPAATVQALGRLPSVWGEALAGHEGWLNRVAYRLAEIDKSGMTAALQQCTRDLSSGT